MICCIQRITYRYGAACGAGKKINPRCNKTANQTILFPNILTQGNEQTENTFGELELVVGASFLFSDD